MSKFQGVRFSYDEAVLGAVKSSDVAAYALQEPDDKPDGVAPRHLLFEFDLEGSKNWKAKLAIYQLKDFPCMYARNPGSEAAMIREIEALHKVISDLNFREYDEIPYLPFVDAGQDFHSKEKPFAFGNGRGIFFITHWSIEMALISNGHLQYMFEGLSNDGEWYVVAQFPISVKFLPSDDSVDKYEGYTLKNMYEDMRQTGNAPRYVNYVNNIAARIDRLSPNEFQPKLKHFEEMIASLSIASQKKQSIAFSNQHICDNR